MSISGEVLISIPVLKESVAREELMTEDYVLLTWNSDKGDILPVGCYVMHDTEKYYLMKPYVPTKVNEQEYRYQPKFESRVVRWKKTPVPIYTYESDGVTVKSREFDWNFTGTPDDAMFIIQRAIFHETGEEWEYTVNEGLPETITISSQASSIWAILSDIAEQCESEWWTEKRISQLHLGKCYHGGAITLEVGKNVKIPSVTENTEEYYTRFYAFGSTRNITQENRVSNGSIVNKRLCLDPVKYPHGYKDIKGHFENGVFVSDLLPEEVFPTTLYFEDVYPSSKLAIDNVRRRLRYRLDEDRNKVVVGGTEDNPVYETYAIWYFQVPSFNFTEDLIIEGQELSVHFKSGQLRGREFALAYHKDAKSVTDSADVDGYFEVKAGDYEIIFDEQTEGFVIPSVDYIIPQNGDEIVLFNIELPSEYVSSSQDELESELDKEIERRTKDNNSYEFSSNPVEFYNAGTFLEVGQKVKFINNGTTLETRVLMVERHLDRPYEQRIRVGNSVIVGTRQQLKDEVREVGQEIDALHSQSNNVASIQRSHERELMLTAGRFLEMQETMKMLEAAVKGYTDAISPITVQTMAMMVGDESLQYRFTASRKSLVSIPCPVSYDSARKQMVATKSALVHLTLGITSITAKDTRKAMDYRSWNMSEWGSVVITEPVKSYYVYAYVEENGTEGTFRLSEVARDMREDNGYLYLLVGILNAEYAEKREFVTVYGFTEVLPSQVITDRIVSADGQTYFDLSKGEIGGLIKFKSNSGQEKSVADLEDEQNDALAGIQDQIDGVVENWNGEGAPTTTNAPVSNWKTDAEKIAHINDTYINIEEYVDDETTPTAGHAWRWCRCEDSTITDQVGVTDKEGNRFNLHWHPIADSDAVRALKEAAEAKRVSEENVARLNVLYDDGLITQAEKFEFLQEQAFINTDRFEIDNQVQKYELTEHSTYTSYVEAFNGYNGVLNTIITTANDEFPLSVEELGLTFQINRFYALRSGILQLIANTTKGLIDSAFEGIEKIPDTEYLRKAFKEGTTEIEGGVVMSEIVAVRDSEDSKVEAFLNGSDYASDTEHGKLLIAAGIPDGTTDLEERAKEAATRIYEDGTLKTVKGEFEGNIKANGGEIGRLKITVNPQTKATTLSSATDYCSKGFMESASLTDGNFGASTSYNDKEGVCNQPYSSTIDGVGLHCSKQYKQDSLETFLDDENWKRGSADIFIEHGNSFDGSETAIKVNSGVFEGLRPSVFSARFNTELNEYDHTIFVETSGITIKLPKSPKIGQRYEIFKPYSNSVNIDPQGVQVYSSGSYGGNNGKGTNVTKIGDSAFVRAVYIYTGTYWFRTIENYD